MKSGRMNITMHQTMLMHMSHCTCQLSEDEKDSWSGEICLTKLLPQDEVLRTFRFEHYGIQVSHIFVWLFQVQDVRVRWNPGDMICHLKCKELLVVVQARNVDEGQQAELLRL